MKKFLIFVVCAMLYALCLASPGETANKFWWASCRIGGGDCLDGIDGNDLTAGDGAIVMMDAGSNTPVRYEYRLHASSTAESDPIVIAPDTNPGTLRWHLVSAFAVSFQAPAVDGLNRIDLAINSARSPATGRSEQYPEGTSTTSRWKMSNQVASTATEDTIVGLNTIDILSNKTFVAPVLGAATGDSVKVTGNNDGLAPTYMTTAATTITVASHGSSAYFFNNTTTAGDPITYALPVPIAGMQYCIKNYTGKTGVLTFQATANVYIDLDGTNGTAAGYIHCDAGGLGTGACVVASDTLHWVAYVNKGSWTAH